MYDVIVIGAGVEGLSTAYYSAKSGYKTLLVEQVNEPLLIATFVSSIKYSFFYKVLTFCYSSKQECSTF